MRSGSKVRQIGFGSSSAIRWQQAPHATAQALSQAAGSPVWD